MWQPARRTEAKHQPSLSAGDWSSPHCLLPHVDGNMATYVEHMAMVSGTLQGMPRETSDLPGRQQGKRHHQHPAYPLSQAELQWQAGP